MDGLAMVCLTLNIYMEARGEPVAGQQAVGLVTVNRAKKRGQGLCETVFQPAQFSWTGTKTRNGVLHPSARPDRRSAMWLRAEQVALQVVQMKDFTGGATYFHAAHIRPAWASQKAPVARIGNHIFYRER